MRIYPNSDLSNVTQKEDRIYKYVRGRFQHWINHPQRSEFRDMYYGDEKVYDSSDAIAQAIEAALDEANETGRPVNLTTFDLEASFE